MNIPVIDRITKMLKTNTVPETAISEDSIPGGVSLARMIRDGIIIKE